MSIVRIAVFSLVSSLVACGSSASSNAPTPTPDAGPTPEVGPPDPVTEWTPCDLRSEGGGPKAECARIQVPLRASDPNGETIEMFVKRYRASGKSSSRAVFMLQGGPGASAYVFEGYVEAVAPFHPDVDWYLPDHRGTGKSTRLGCPKQEAETSGAGGYILPSEWKACLAAVKAQWGDKLAAFDTTNAANDLGLLVERAKKEHANVFVYGVSYGTYWANRYLQMFPKQPSGVILDSIAPPGLSLARQDEDANVAGKLIFEECAKHEICTKHLGPDPWAKAQAVFQKIEKEGHCSDAAPGGVPLRLALRRAFGQLAMTHGPRAYIPIVVARVDRCTPADAAAVKKMLTLFFPTESKPAGEMFKQYSFVLGNNIGLSELWEDPSPTEADLTAIRDSAIVSRDVTEGLGQHIGKWPLYSKDKWAGGYADTDVPVLMMHAPLDPATLLTKARVMKSKYAKPNQRWIEVANGSHSIVSTTPTKAMTSCGTSMFMSFVKDPAKGPDLACLSNLAPISFEGTPENNMKFFGTASAWD